MLCARGTYTAMALTAFVTSGAFATTARAEVFVLASGGQIEGQWLNPGESPRKNYVIQLTSGGQVTLERDQVREVKKPKPEEIEYEKIRNDYPDTVDGHWQLSEWCRDHRLEEQRKLHLRRILELDPNHVATRRLLGYSLHGGVWKTNDEFWSERGYVLHEGKWRLPQDITLEDEQRKRELGEKAWARNLKLWRAALDSDKASEAVKNVRAIDDPLAVAALKLMLDDEPVRDVRLLWVEALMRIGTPDAVRRVAEQTLADPDSEVRATGLELLAKKPRPDVVSFFIQKLKDKNNVVVNRAAIGLKQLNDPTAVGPLVDALVTTHKFAVTTGNPGGGTSAAFSPQGGAGLSQGSSTTIVSQLMQNESVLDALVTITKTNFGFQQADWKKWLAAQRRTAPLDARRGT